MRKESGMGRVIAMAVGIALLGGPALARVTVCDKFSVPIYAAVGYVINGDTETQGWWAVAPGKCVVVDQGPVASPFYLMTRTAPDPKGKMKVWGTGTPLVVAMNKFHYYDTETSGANDTVMKFQEVTKADSQDQPNLTWTVKDAKTVTISYDATP